MQWHRVVFASGAVQHLWSVRLRVAGDLVVARLAGALGYPRRVCRWGYRSSYPSLATCYLLSEWEVRLEGLPFYVVLFFFLLSAGEV